MNGFIVPDAQTQGKLFETHVIGKNTLYETPYYVLKGPLPGPVVLLEAGIHGDELAGIHALYRVLPRLRVQAGTVIILPRMNRPACAANQRYLNVDLNRVFPGFAGGEHYEYALAREIFAMLGREKVEYVLTLHESRYRHNPRQGKNLGQTIIYGVNPMPPYLNTWLAAVNQAVADHETFHPLYHYVQTSSTEVFVDKYRLKGGFCVETWMGFDLARRIELHQLVVLKFLDTIKFKYFMEK